MTLDQHNESLGATGPVGFLGPRGDKKEKSSMEKNYNTIEITFANGHAAIWEADKGEWDDYAYDGSAFIIKKNGSWVGIYNMNHVISIVVK